MDITSLVIALLVIIVPPTLAWYSAERQRLQLEIERETQARLGTDNARKLANIASIVVNALEVAKKNGEFKPYENDAKAKIREIEAVAARTFYKLLEPSGLKVDLDVVMAYIRSEYATKTKNA